MGRNHLLYLIIAVVTVVGLFYLTKPKSNYNPQPNSQVKTFDLVVKNKKLVSGQETLKVTEGDQVTINITNDEPEELHLHGYDKSVDLEASKAAQLKFSANLTGRFSYELEHSKIEIGVLEVQPK